VQQVIPLKPQRGGCAGLHLERKDLEEFMQEVKNLHAEFSEFKVTQMKMLDKIE
jgi:hypothetical protein